MSALPPLPSWWIEWFQPERAKAMRDEYVAAGWARLRAVRLERGINETRAQIIRLKRELSPEWRQHLTELLAKHEANLDALEDDGVAAIQKGDE